MARKSVRSYTSRPVEKEKVDIMLKAAMAAPSAVNKQPWSFIVIDDKEVLNHLAQVLPYAKMTAEAPMAIVVCGDLTKSLNEELDNFCWQPRLWDWELYGQLFIRKNNE